MKALLIWFLLSILFFTLSVSASVLETKESYIVYTNHAVMPSQFATPLEWYKFMLYPTTFHPISTYDLQQVDKAIFHIYELGCPGFAARLTAAQVDRLSRTPGVLQLNRDVAFLPQTTRSPDFIGLNVDFGLWPESELGDGVIIGIIDTGVWPEADSFDDTGLQPAGPRWKGECENGEGFNSTMCNNKLIGARFITSGSDAAAQNLREKNSNSSSPSSSDEFQEGYTRSARDDSGHGTLVASTAAGSAVPNANADGDDTGYIVRGMARGIATKAKLAMYKVCQKNCLPSDIRRAFHQAVIDGVDIINLSLSPESGEVNYHINDIAIGAYEAVTSGIFVAAGAGNTEPTFGASGGFGTVVHTAPWIMTVGASTIDRQFIHGLTIVGENRAPSVADFSGRGPNPIVPEILKPDIVAPGVQIIAASIPRDPPKLGQRARFELQSGTSMASPHVAGLAALIRGIHPSWSPAAIRSALMTTASTMDNQFRLISRNFLVENLLLSATPFDFGAGQVYPLMARDPGLVYNATEPDYLQFLCTLNYTKEQMKVFTEVPELQQCSGKVAEGGILPQLYNLNYPSISVIFDPREDFDVTIVVYRELTMVSEPPINATTRLPGTEIYHGRVVNLVTDQVDIFVAPLTLEFDKIDATKGYSLHLRNLVEDYEEPKQQFGFAYVIWESEFHIVKSPVVVTWK